MNHLSKLALSGLLLLLAACDSGHKVTYSGHEESTEGVPGYVNGKKVSPNVKLGQSYSVDGETYVPRNQPDYVEEGLASWYGPGFHGGKTANGERFDKNELTAAHRTLPLPSIVRVTMLSTGKQVYVRINDRGPFAKSRIIDLSRAAADKIGLLRAGVAKVRVEYMPKESQRFADLLGQGRDPKSIDIASEVLNYSDGESNVARADVRTGGEEQAASDTTGGSFWDRFNKSADGEPTQTVKAAPVSDVVTTDLASAPAAMVPAKGSNSAKIMEADKVPAVAIEAQGVDAAETDHNESPFSVLSSAAGKQDAPVHMASIPQTPAPAVVAAPVAVPNTPPTSAAVAPKPMMDTVSTMNSGKIYVQLGAFGNEANAERLRKQYANVSGLQVTKKENASGVTLYHVRMGPYTTVEASNNALAKARDAGADAKIIRE